MEYEKGFGYQTLTIRRLGLKWVPERPANGDETRWDVGRVYQRKRVDTLAWRALVTARRKRWLRDLEDRRKDPEGEKPIRMAPTMPRRSVM